MIVIQLAFQDANAICKTASRPLRKAVSLIILGFVQILYIPGLAITTALQGKTIKDILSQQRNRDQREKGLQGLLEASSDMILWDICSSSVPTDRGEEGTGSVPEMQERKTLD